ncbi:hypothetical protein NLG97_g7219 [Lecanicillium saksenae]|uniref:Uncharacterized protein n=1 Tax=Lecanicillium saksenae TaxID=468837 RepID=A0ACC1QQM8_9HYPO|nr:hypothetical protein NLG97_g7219 [Lecanicillium saksenae]
MVLFSSCGQLVGFTGQSSYASCNAFLDGLATHRRGHQGDTSVSFLWTSWRDMGMVASSSYIVLELESKGITDVSREEAFAAWMHVAWHEDVNHAVVLRARTTLGYSMAPLPILEYIVRRPSHDEPETVASHEKLNSTANGASATTKASLADVIQACVAEVLRVEPDDVDPLGMDSVMMVMLRRLFQQSLKIKTPPTLIWSYPTVNMLVGWFAGKLAVD